MKTLGYIFLLLITVFGAFFGYTAYRTAKDQPLFEPYIREISPVIAEWNFEDAKYLFTDEALNAVSEKKWKEAFAYFSQLGELVNIGEIQQTFFTVNLGTSGAQTVGNYIVPLSFANGPAHFQLRLIKKGDKIKIHYIHVSSEIFMKELAEPDGTGQPM